MDWTNASEHITDHFTVGDMITLHSWNRLANDQDGLTDEIKDKLLALCQKMEEIREFLGCPINVHCGFRSQDYNTQVVGAIANDVHAQGLAIDFDCNGHYTIEELHQKLEPVLEEYDIRMERGTTTWIHLDLRTPGPSGRYFTA